jgi:hypothetical protein
LKKSLKDQAAGVEKLIDAAYGNDTWDIETRTTHRIALDLAIKTIDLLHKQLNKEFLEK